MNSQNKMFDQLSIYDEDDEYAEPQRNRYF